MSNLSDGGTTPRANKDRVGNPPTVGVLVSGVSQFASLSAFMVGLRQTDSEIVWYLVGGRDTEFALPEYIQENEAIKIVPRSRTKLAILKLLQIVLTPSNYSAMWARWKRTIYFTRWFRVLMHPRPSRKTRMIKNWLLADVVTDYVGKLLGNRRLYPGLKTLIIPTVCSDLDLVCGIKPKRVVFADGWDHLDKRPLGFRPDLVIPWNDDLGNSFLRRVNNQTDTHLIAPAEFPFKLSWVEALQEPRFHRRVNPNFTRVERAVVLFAMTMSTDVYDRVRLLEEIELLHEIADSLTDHVLIVKPKPGDSREVLRNLGVTNRYRVQDSFPERLGDYHLSKKYNSSRALTLSRVDLVLGIGTTFLLDAALAKIPVLRIEAKSSSAPLLAEAMSFDHWALLDSLITPEFYSPRVQGTDSRSPQEQYGSLTLDLSSAVRYSQMLSTWLNPLGISAVEASMRWWMSDSAARILR